MEQSKQNLTTEDLEFFKNNYPDKGGRFCADKLGIGMPKVEKLAAKFKLKRTNINLFIWTPEKTKWLSDNYSSQGSQYCAEYLKIPLCKIHDKAKRMKLNSPKKYKRDIRDMNNYKVPAGQFLNIKEPHIAYILGLIWADGTIKKYIAKSGSCIYNVNIKNKTSDVDSIKHLFDKTGVWAFNDASDKKQPTWQPITQVCTSNRHIVDFLIENDYKIKKIVSADKILSHIPVNLHRYWFLGVIDGDGCFSSTGASCVVTSTYDQDWTYFERLYNSLGLTYKINRVITKKGHKSSNIVCANKNNLKKLYDYLYPFGFEFGFYRKYIKCYNSLNIAHGRKFIYYTPYGIFTHKTISQLASILGVSKLSLIKKCKNDINPTGEELNKPLYYREYFDIHKHHDYM